MSWVAWCVRRALPDIHVPHAKRPATGEDRDGPNGSGTDGWEESGADPLMTKDDDRSATLAPDVHAALVLDRAGWHGAASLAVPPNVTLVPLPPYAPKLNLIERVWLYLRERHLSYRVLADHDAVVEPLRSGAH